jgi:putative toxin-antitoxin system antitoxin component (TIGR02293 family)
MRKDDGRNPGVYEVLRRADEVFKDLNKATLWLNSPNYALGDQIPIQLIESEEGIELVLDELGRIEHGIPL